MSAVALRALEDACSGFSAPVRNFPPPTVLGPRRPRRRLHIRPAPRPRARPQLFVSRHGTRAGAAGGGGGGSCVPFGVEPVPLAPALGLLRAGRRRTTAGSPPRTRRSFGRRLARARPSAPEGLDAAALLLEAWRRATSSPRAFRFELALNLSPWRAAPGFRDICSSERCSQLKNTYCCHQLCASGRASGM